MMAINRRRPDCRRDFRLSAGRWISAIIAFALVPLTQAAAPRFARLGNFEGPVEVQLDAADSWRPAALNLPLPESARIRTGPASRVEIELDDTSVFRMSGEGLAELSDYTSLSGGQRITVISLDHGLAYFTGDPGSSSAIHLLVPGAQASIKQGSRIRLLALDTSSEIAIIEGAIRLTMPSAEMDLRQGQSARVTVPESTHFSLFREIAPLESDGWNEQLDKAEAEKPASRLDLDHAGKWIVAGDYGTVWQPTPVARNGANDATWSPFRQGRWIWLQSLGFTWVASEPWGWKPYHEGRWLQHSDLGWVWLPAPKNSAAFSPGDVFWARTTNLAAWGPLAPNEPWNGAGPPRQFAAFNITGGTFVSGAREILPSPAEDLPKDLLKVFLFTSALPSPPLPLARLNATRDALRTRLYTAVDVPPAPRVITEVIPPTSPDTVQAPIPVAAAPLPVGDPVIAPDPMVVDNRPIVPGVIIVSGPAKSRDKKTSTSATSSKTSATPSKPSVYVPPSTVYLPINGAGAATAAPLYQNWFQQFKEAQISYQPNGVASGLRQLSQGLLDFAASDVPLTDKQLGDSSASLLHFPSAVGAVIPIYNVPGIYDGLKLSPELLAGIYLGEIRYWNDRRILALNPRATVPNTAIILVNRSDPSTATYTWTDYLSKISPLWKAKVGAATSITWPITGLSAKGDEGVVNLVHQTPYSLGFVDLSIAEKHEARGAAIRNRAGQFVFASPENLTAAAATAVPSDGSATDFRKSITDAPGDQAYPIAAFTYLLVPSRITNPQKSAALTDFLRWMLTEGQKQNANFQLAPLPPELASRERRQVSLINKQ